MGARYPLFAALILSLTLLSVCAVTAAAGNETPDPGGLETSWDEGIGWASDSGRLKLRFGGRLLVDARPR